MVTWRRLGVVLLWVTILVVVALRAFTSVAMDTTGERPEYCVLLRSHPAFETFASLSREDQARSVICVLREPVTTSKYGYRWFLDIGWVLVVGCCLVVLWAMWRARSWTWTLFLPPRNGDGTFPAQHTTRFWPRMFGVVAVVTAFAWGTRLFTTLLRSYISCGLAVQFPPSLSIEQRVEQVDDGWFFIHPMTENEIANEPLYLFVVQHLIYLGPIAAGALGVVWHLTRHPRTITERDQSHDDAALQSATKLDRHTQSGEGPTR